MIENDSIQKVLRAIESDSVAQQISSFRIARDALADLTLVTSDTSHPDTTGTEILQRHSSVPNGREIKLGLIEKAKCALRHWVQEIGEINVAHNTVVSTRLNGEDSRICRIVQQ